MPTGSLPAATATPTRAEGLGVPPRRPARRGLLAVLGAGRAVLEAMSSLQSLESSAAEAVRWPSPSRGAGWSHSLAQGCPAGCPRRVTAVPALREEERDRHRQG